MSFVGTMTTEFLHEQGSRLWPKTYKLRAVDDHFAAMEIYRYVNVMAEASGDWTQWCVHTPNGPILRSDLVFPMIISAKWVDGGCRILESDEKYFAAMAQTKLSKDAATELRVPWPAFVVRLPSGLFVSESGEEYTIALCGQFENLPSDTTGTVKSGAFYAFYSETSCTFNFQECNLAELLFREVDDSEEGGESPDGHLEDRVECSDSDSRISEMIRRGIVGLLFTMQHTNNFKFGGAFSKASMSSRGAPPPHRSIVIGRPMSVDVSESVRQDARSGGVSPSFQTLVRGHIKRQVVGVGRTGRKVVWIEPYWRGPEDAPILARPYRIGSTRTVQAT